MPTSPIKVSSHIGTMFLLSIIDVTMQTISKSPSCVTYILDRTSFTSYQVEHTFSVTIYK